MQPQPIRIGGFRSLVEFEWATTFHACGIKYAYEPKLFTLMNDVNYLPDFYLITPGGLKLWAEIKARKFKHEEKKKCNLLSMVNHERVVELRGFPSTGRTYDGWIDGEHFPIGFNSKTFLDAREWTPKTSKTHSIVNAVQRVFDSQRNPHYQEFINELKRGNGGKAWQLVQPICYEGRFSLTEPLTHLQRQGWHDYRDGDNDVPIA